MHVQNSSASVALLNGQATLAARATLADDQKTASKSNAPVTPSQRPRR
ncbi:MAG: hypothetical protein JKY92_01300 [Magnetovibrio sp.]|nr:hypothetical protein [Magnetovibrio sp.]